MKIFLFLTSVFLSINMTKIGICFEIAPICIILNKNLNFHVYLVQKCSKFFLSLNLCSFDQSLILKWIFKNVSPTKSRWYFHKERGFLRINSIFNCYSRADTRHFSADIPADSFVAAIVIDAADKKYSWFFSSW